MTCNRFLVTSSCSLLVRCHSRASKYRMSRAKVLSMTCAQSVSKKAQVSIRSKILPVHSSAFLHAWWTCMVVFLKLQWHVCWSFLLVPLLQIQAGVIITYLVTFSCLIRASLQSHVTWLLRIVNSCLHFSLLVPCFIPLRPPFPSTLRCEFRNIFLLQRHWWLCSHAIVNCVP